MIENTVLHTRLIEKLFPSLFLFNCNQIEMKSIDIWVRVENYIWKLMLRVSATKKFEFHKKRYCNIAANSSQSFSVLPEFFEHIFDVERLSFPLRAVCNFLTFFSCRCLTAASPARYGVITFRLYLGSSNFRASMFFYNFHFCNISFLEFPFRSEMIFRSPDSCFKSIHNPSSRRIECCWNMQFCLRFPINLFSNRKSRLGFLRRKFSLDVGSWCIIYVMKNFPQAQRKSCGGKLHKTIQKAARETFPMNQTL